MLPKRTVRGQLFDLLREKDVAMKILDD